MSEEQRRASIADLSGYRGEVSRRRLPVALLLNVLMPGLGHVYVGRARRGVGVYLATALAFVTLGVVAWGTNLFLPRAALIALAAWAHIQVLLALRVRRHVLACDDAYVLTRYNHPLVYIGLLVALEIAPGWALGRFAFDQVVVGFTVSDRCAFPELLTGDRVYGSRGAFEDTAPARGALVIVAGAGERPTVLRVMAVPGDEVALEGGTVIVNGVPRYREPLGAIEVFGRDPAPAEVEPIRAFREYSDRVSYEIYVPAGVEPQDRAPRRLADDEYFLLADLRDVEGVHDSRRLGPFRREHIVGRPLYVWWSTVPGEARVRWARVGLEIQ